MCVLNRQTTTTSTIHHTHSHVLSFNIFKKKCFFCLMKMYSNISLSLLPLSVVFSICVVFRRVFAVNVKSLKMKNEVWDEEEEENDEDDGLVWCCWRRTALLAYVHWIQKKSVTHTHIVTSCFFFVIILICYTHRLSFSLRFSFFRSIVQFAEHIRFIKRVSVPVHRMYLLFRSRKRRKRERESYFILFIYLCLDPSRRTFIFTLAYQMCLFSIFISIPFRPLRLCLCA